LHEGATYRNNRHACDIVITGIATGVSTLVIVVAIVVILHCKRGFNPADAEPVHNSGHNDFGLAGVNGQRRIEKTLG
jgi:hypothetical protein